MGTDRDRVRDIFLKHEYGPVAHTLTLIVPPCGLYGVKHIDLVSPMPVPRHSVSALKDRKQITDVLLDRAQDLAVAKLVYGYTFTRVPQCYMPHQQHVS